MATNNPNTEVKVISNQKKPSKITTFRALLHNIFASHKDKPKKVKYKPSKTYKPHSANDNIMFYMIYSIKREILYTIVCTPRQAAEYIERHLYLSHYTAFNNYCKAHGNLPNNFVTWLDYGPIAIPALAELRADYCVTPMVRSYGQIATILRSVMDLRPIGCSYENDLEEQFVKEFGTFVDDLTAPLPQKKATPSSPSKKKKVPKNDPVSKCDA